MGKNPSLRLSWDFLSRLVLAVFFLLQVIRWRILPQFMDIYYHLLTAWGFNQAGGWTVWDFWQYAPAGRNHIYPPFLHLTMGLLLKAGVPAMILAKSLELAAPVALLFTARKIIKRNFDERLAFFSLVCLASSYALFMNLVNHIPATLSLVFGLLAFDRLCSGKRRWATVLLVFAFYTHIGISWFFALGFFFYAVFDREVRGRALSVLAAVILISAPVILIQFNGLKDISGIGLNLYERNLIQFKTVEYLLAVLGLSAVLKKTGKYLFFPAFFLAGLIFLSYPYRYFCAEGYLPLAFLAAIGLDTIWKSRFRPQICRFAAGVLCVFIFVLSPSVIMDKPLESNVRTLKFAWAESAFTPLAFPLLKPKPLGDSIWLPQDYLPAARFIRENSRPDEIIYSNLNMLGVTLAGISGRATANGLFPEIKPDLSFDPIAGSRIVIITSDQPPETLQQLETAYKLKRFAASRLFTFYRNDSALRTQIRANIIPSWVFWSACLAFLALAVPTFSKKRNR